MAERYKILYLYEPEPEVEKIVRPYVPKGWDFAFVDPKNKAEVAKHLPDTDFIMGVKLSAQDIAAAPKLKMAALHGVGYDSVDRKALAARGIPLCMTVPGTCGGVAEHTILFILAVYKHLLEADQALRKGIWLSSSLRTRCYLFEGKTLGLVGLGRIGREVVKRARGLDPKIIYCDIYRAKPEVEKQLGITYAPLDDLLRTSDIVSLHVPLTPQTDKFIDARALALMKPTAIFINTSRGGVVDEPALYHALEERRIMGAGLDVFDVEPALVDNPLFRLDNVVVTPHMATGTRDSMAQKAEAAFENFQRYLRGEPLFDEVKPD